MVFEKKELKISQDKPKKIIKLRKLCKIITSSTIDPNRPKKSIPNPKIPFFLSQNLKITSRMKKLPLRRLISPAVLALTFSFSIHIELCLKYFDE